MFMRERLLSGAPPTVREVQQEFGFRAVATAREHLDRLIETGLLIKARRRARGFSLPGPGGKAERPSVIVPLLGSVAAGDLRTAMEEAEGYITVQSRHITASGIAASGRADEFFALRVEGESMKNAAILPGDIVVVRRQSSAENGDIVVALVDDEATVKRLRLRRGCAELHPENPAFSAIIPSTTGGELRILGKVIQVRRDL